MARMGHHPLGGQKIMSGVLSEQGRQNWDAIFPPKDKTTDAVVVTPFEPTVTYIATEAPVEPLTMDGGQ